MAKVHAIQFIVQLPEGTSHEEALKVFDAKIAELNENQQVILTADEVYPLQFLCLEK